MDTKNKNDPTLQSEIEETLSEIDKAKNKYGLVDSQLYKAAGDGTREEYFMKMLSLLRRVKENS